MEGDARPLIGREDELHALTEAIDHDRPIVVTGEAGIGKTSLVRAAAAAASRPLYEAPCFATLSWLPYLPLRRVTGTELAGDPAFVASGLERHVGPGLLFVDDLPWADQDTAMAVGLALGRILVVASVRDGDADAERRIVPFRRAGALVLRLSGLAETDAATVVRRWRPGASDRLVGDIVRQAAGNPLLLEELAVRGAPSAALERAIVGRVADLPAEARAAVELLALADRPLPRASVGRAVDKAIEAGLVLERGADVEVRHQLVADAIRAGLDTRARRRMHSKLAEIVTDRAQAAHQLAEAGRRDDAAALAMEALRGAADPRERAALLVVAAEASSEDGPRLRLQAARALDEVSEWSAVRRVLADAGGEGTDEDGVERDALLAHAMFATGDIAAGRELLVAARSRSIAPTSGAAARRVIEEATLLVNVDGAVAAAVALLDEALAQRWPDDAIRRDLEVLRASIVMLASGAADVPLLLAAVEEAFATGRYRTATDRARVVQYLLLMGVGSEAGLTFLLEQVQRYEEARVGTVALEFRADAVQAALLAGHLGRAVTLADELLERPAPQRAAQAAAIFRARALGLMGLIDEADGAMTEVEAIVSEDFLGRGELHAGRAELALWSGRPGDAIEHADSALAIVPPIPAAHVLPAVTRAWARWELDRDPGPPPDIPLTPSLAGAVPELAGLAASGAGDDRVAAAAFAEAASSWEVFHAPRALVCRWASAESLRRAGELATAIERLESTLAEATANGFEPLAARIRRSLRQAGVRVSGAPRSAIDLGSGLTGRERELVALVEQGHSNMEIARRLGLGRPTVARILSSAMVKLGAERRAQLATATRRASPPGDESR
jgi:DNA-binding CsgD family transcriptional regulator